MTERITLDLTGSDDATKEPDYSHLPKGHYKAVVYSVETRKTGENSKNPGKPYYNIRLNILEEGEYHARVVFDGFVGLYTTEAAPWLAQKAEQLSIISGVWDGEDRSNVTIATPEELQGTEVEAYITVKRDTYAEEKEGSSEPIYRNEVASYRPVGGWPSAEDLAKGNKPAGKKKAQKITL